jgi:serine protease SohB
MDFLNALTTQVAPSILGFLAKGLILVALIGITVLLLAAFAQAKAMRPKPTGRLEARSLNDEWMERRRSLEGLYLSKKEWKERIKFDEKRDKSRSELGVQAKRLWVLDFKGDLTASRVSGFRHEVTALIDLISSSQKSPQDEVLVRIESPGGTVTGYGLAAAQLARLRAAGFQITASVDEIAASGGYLLASVAHQIIAAPFAIVGSIGVVASLPNFNRLLKQWNVDYVEITAGEHKRPISLFGELNEEGLKKFREQIQLTHGQFSNHVSKFRPQLDIAKVANGDVWHAEEGLKLGLVDAIQTSDGFIEEAILKKDLDVISVAWKESKGLRARLEEETVRGLKALSRLSQMIQKSLQLGGPLSS